MIQDAIAKLFSRQHLTVAEAEAVMNELVTGAATPAQVGAYLAALRVNGESPEELAGSILALRSHMKHVPTRGGQMIDVVGTGGDKSNTFNISTTSAFVVAGAGLTVAKHGNRAASSQSGAADVLAALGVELALTPEQVGACIDEVGIGFMFAQLHHPAMKHVAGVRRELGSRTIFNLIGPPTNPASAPHHLLGVAERGLIQPIAQMLITLGTQGAWVVNGTAGAQSIDELTTAGPNFVAEVRNGQINMFELDAREYGLTPTTLDALGGGSPDFNAAITRSVLDGSAGAARTDVVVLNAGAALAAAGFARDLRDGLEMARAAISSGAAHAKLDALITKSQSYAAAAVEP